MRFLKLLIRAAICSLLVLVPLRGVDDWLYDRFFRLRGQVATPTPLILVRINPEKVPKTRFPTLHQRTVWNGNFYEPLLETILTQNPKLVLFASYYDSARVSRPELLINQKLLFSAILNDENKIIPPPTDLIDIDNFGFSNIFPDPDNTVRHTNLYYSSTASLAVRAGQVLGLSTKRDLLQPLWINFRGPGQSFPSLDASDILDKTATLTVTDRIVLIGKEGTRSSEFETPFGKMSALEIQANILQNYLFGNEIHILPRWTASLVGIFSILAGMAIALFCPLSLVWLWVLIVAAIEVALSFILLSLFQIWLGIASGLFCLIGSHLVMLGYALQKQEEKQWKTERESQLLREMDEFKNNFIALFSHDLKTPLAKIKAIVRRICADYPELPSDVGEALMSVQKTNDELSRLINDILKVTKMESMKIDPERSVVDLNRLVETAVGRLRFMAEEKNIQIILDLEPLFSIEGDGQLILEVIINLLENALKYSPSYSKVIIRTSEDAEKILVSVLDEGPGIPEEEIPRVTGKFYRGKINAIGTKGSGLGLYLSKYFVELHNGNLEIRNRPDQGACIGFTLPSQSS